MGYVTNGFKLLTPVMLLSALEEVLYQYFRVGKVTVKCKEQTPYNEPWYNEIPNIMNTFQKPKLKICPDLMIKFISSHN